MGAGAFVHPLLEAILIDLHLQISRDRSATPLSQHHPPRAQWKACDENQTSEVNMMWDGFFKRRPSAVPQYIVCISWAINSILTCYYFLQAL